MPQDQDDIKGADAMKQAPTPGPLSGDQHQWICKCCYTEFSAPQSEHLTDPFGGHAGAACPTCKAGGQFTYLVGFHQGDPCIHCKTPHDEVEPGPCHAFRLAPTAPVEASGAERDTALSILQSAVRSFDSGDTTNLNGVLDDILDALRPQPSGETREVPAWVKPMVAALEGYEADYGGPLDDMHELGRIEESRSSPSFRIRVGHVRQLALIRPAPVASGGQHSSGEGGAWGYVSRRIRLDGEPCEQPWSSGKIGDGFYMLTVDDPDWETLTLYARPSPTPVAETAGEAVAWRRRPIKETTGSGKEWVLYGPEDAAHYNAATDRYVIQALGIIGSVPAQDDDKLRTEVVRIANMITPNNIAEMRRVGDLHAWCERIRAALKSTAAQEGGE